MKMNGRRISYCMLLIIISCFLGYVYSEKCDKSDEDHRLKRQVNAIPLIYPYGGTYKMGRALSRDIKTLIFKVAENFKKRKVDKESFEYKSDANIAEIVAEATGYCKKTLLIGFSTPVKLKDGMSLLFAANFQYQYVQFTNISQLSQYYYVKDVSSGRELRDVDLWNRKDERITFYKSFAGLLDSRGMNGQECVLRAICEAAQYPVEKEGLVGKIMHILLTPDYGHTAFDDEDKDHQEDIAPYRDAAVVGRQMFSCASVFKGCPEGQGVMELVSLLRDE